MEDYCWIETCFFLHYSAAIFVLSDCPAELAVEAIVRHPKVTFSCLLSDPPLFQQLATSLLAPWAVFVKQHQLAVFNNFPEGGERQASPQ